MVIVIKSPGTPFRRANKGLEVGHCQEVHPLIKNGPVNQNRFVALMSNSRARIAIIRSKQLERVRIGATQDLVQII